MWADDVSSTAVLDTAVLERRSIPHRSMDVSGDGTYLHGVGRDGKLIGQNGPYLPDESAAIDEGRRALRRLGARRVIRVDAATSAAALAQAEQVLHEQGTSLPPEPWSAADRIGRVLAMVGVAASVRVARFRSRRFRDGA